MGSSRGAVVDTEWLRTLYYLPEPDIKCIHMWIVYCVGVFRCRNSEDYSSRVRAVEKGQGV